MHKLTMKFFRLLANTLDFCRIVSVFFVAILTLYWIQVLTSMYWNWFNIFRPILDALLAIAEKIYSVSFTFGESIFDTKFINAILILVAINVTCYFLKKLIIIIKNLYIDTHNFCKETQEKNLNKKLQESVKQKELKINTFDVTIHTRIKQQPVYTENKINILEQNQLMNNFILEQLSSKPEVFENGFIYHFKNIEKLDRVLSVLFRVLASKAPIEYAICIQAGNQIEQLKRLVNLQIFGKIILARDTAHRYQYNKNQEYNIAEVGIYQNANGTTIQVEEFKK